ncbi:MAG: 30S ribosomal protein S17 [Gammaproteobacteria bacterium]|nr:30S ribosomal protein S17 [Gammaproteobacteria bacterium]
MNEPVKTQRTLTGTVVSNKMDKTIAVLVERSVKHPLYEKYVRKSSKVLAHDENNECREGDVVVIESSRPISKRKAWRLHKIVERAHEV